MRILNQDNGRSIKNILPLLTDSEATELRDDLGRLLFHKVPNGHSHINDSEYVHELSLALYSANDTAQFDDRVKKLILFDE